MILMTYNIMHGLDYIKLLNKERFIDLDKICDVIKKYNPDIISLNEVYNDLKGINQVEYIAKKLGYDYYYFGKSINLKDDLLYGNAIISKYEIVSPEIINIPDPIIHDEDVYYETRIIIKCKIKDYNVYVTHIGLAKSEQNNAINVLKNELTNKNNVILMGDFNIEENKLPIINKNLLNTSKFIKGTNYTYPSIKPIKKIDYILISNDIDVQKSLIGKIVASDHFPVIVKIK